MTLSREIKVFAENALGDAFLEIAAGSSDDAHLGLDHRQMGADLEDLIEDVEAPFRSEMQIEGG